MTNAATLAVDSMCGEWYGCVKKKLKARPETIAASPAATGPAPVAASGGRSITSAIAATFSSLRNGSSTSTQSTSSTAKAMRLTARRRRSATRRSRAVAGSEVTRRPTSSASARHGTHGPGWRSIVGGRERGATPCAPEDIDHVTPVDGVADASALGAARHEPVPDAGLGDDLARRRAEIDPPAQLGHEHPDVGALRRV